MMKISLKVFLFTLCLCFAAFQVVRADTTYVSGGNITSNTTWSYSGSPYVILGDIIVAANQGFATLTIEPGVEVLFAPNAGLKMGNRPASYGYWGALQAKGTPDSMIVFSSLSGETNGWDGIYFYNCADASTMEYCVVENAGQSGWGVQANLYCFETSRPISISNCTIRDATGTGVYLRSSSISITSTEFSGDSIGVYLDPSSYPYLRGNTYSTISHGIAVAGRTFFGSSWTWRNDNGEPLVILGDIIVAANQGFATLTIEPGVEVLFAPNAGLKMGNRPASYG
ncbi:MAG: right-handed parallel beta-helix repeat-containing protein, partial [Desulfobacterales bacterium]|nr:right-handed parallel beta-helix repeat-containing protein [Desulfobacterales bacterium]